MAVAFAFLVSEDMPNNVSDVVAVYDPYLKYTDARVDEEGIDDDGVRGDEEFLNEASEKAKLERQPLHRNLDLSHTYYRLATDPEVLLSL